uniref:receptor-like protein EIX2 n=1 Tax=Erigeron canadensis TaxID=72917 RepID=UPI001CB976ED|nr:receptor-like protein EIX2 [Erigeron canadensis]
MDKNMICHKLLHTVFFIQSFFPLWLKATTAFQQVEATTGPANGTVINKKCFDNEIHALLDFKAMILKDDFGSHLSTWGNKQQDDQYCCKWTGVTCSSRTGHVVKLELSFVTFKGEISPSLLNLTRLNNLDLSYNYFHGTIPTFIGSMTELRYLDLSGSTFYGTIPSEFGNLRNLKKLSLRYLQTVKNLDWLSHLSLLEYLDMSGTSLAKVNNWVNVVVSLKNLSFLSLSNCDLSQVMCPYSKFVNSSSSSSIVTLDLGNNNLNSSAYRWLFPLTSNKLQTLDLSSNMLDWIPKYLGNLSNLTSVFLQYNFINVSFPVFLSNLSGYTSSTLQYLEVSHNQLTGSLPDEIQKFTSLQNLFLSHNHLNGTISEKVWEQPKLEQLDATSNSLRGANFQNIGKSNILYIYLANNSLEGVPLTYRNHMSNLSHTVHIDLSSCKLGPQFPKWIQTLKNLVHLDIANNRISDTVPIEFWDTWSSQLSYLNLSSNNLSGEVLNLLSNFDRCSTIDLSSNSFYGPIPNVSSTLEALNLSKNKFHGGISFLCHLNGSLSFLDLSHNSLTGQVPDCLWHFKELKVLSLGHNRLAGSLPPSMGYLVQLEVLSLYNNSFSGELPLSIKNCQSLKFLDLGANMFSGNVPIWIGENLFELYVFSLRSNNFSGTTPLQICELVNLQILDLSMNNLQGTIPSCVYNFSRMFGAMFYQDPNVHLLNATGEYVDHQMIQWQGIIREFSSNLGLLMSIDLSSNNLTGPVPYELTDLHQLVSLNLSKNALFGEIPPKIGEMNHLLTLDLSRNKFSGGIPSSMSQMSSLNYLDVSYNSLSGRIPSSTQLQTFEPSRYIGNAELCGSPLPKYCSEDEDLHLPNVGEGEGGSEGLEELQRWFYIGAAIGFTIGFWVMCSTLLLNRRVRHTFIGILDRLEDWAYMNVMVFAAKLQRVAPA